jgi:hypothetical protein
MRFRNRFGIGGVVAVAALVAIGSAAPAQNSPTDSPVYYVANTRPPDAFLSLRTHPTSISGQRIMTMPNGTRLQVLRRQDNGWWYVRALPSGQQGWVLSQQGNRIWIECCAAASADRTEDQIKQEPAGFKTPSSNIHCRVDVDEGAPGQKSIGHLRCDIREITGAVPPKPGDCDFDWGQAFGIAEDGRAGRRLCYSDTVADDALPALAYGNAWQRGGFTCKSEPAGLTCSNASGHGFALSKNDQRLF